MNSKIYKLTLSTVAALLIASGCSPQEGNNNNGADGAANNNGQVVEQPQDSANNGSNEANNGGNEADNGNNEADNGNAEGEGQKDPGQADDADTDEAQGEVTADGIIEQIISEVEMGALQTLDEQQVKDVYGIDPAELLEEGVFRPALMNVHAYELTVVKLKSEEAYEEVAAAMEERAASIQKTFETYLPAQYEASQQYQIIREGDFVLFSITPDQEKTAEIFKSSLAE